ncbi:MAG: undecaprenyl/decaprenyl-phosphate alpha-N-acetylglucosaminyl 1-phosphate transferase [Anaerolineae bacterium]|jgi:UDP-GlcNAc:undecaprenyl-phosphate GlcNAc-1-phosphate transferase|nr:undecaprenyl/decaprenyl-phosphate alpha-N-acetylglucosaminyl 1-phosphate transferase [Anaerolineae bacterium]
MTTYILILASALIVAIGVTPLVQRLARRTGMVDKPSARKQHTVPTPLLGGLAIYLGVIIALILLGDRFYVNQIVGIFVGATLVSFLGLWDDRRGLSPLVKLGGQFLAAGIVTLTDVRIGLFPYEWMNIGATLLWIVGITNAFNLLDNMDGLSGGIAAIAALFFLLFAAMSRQYLVGALAAALVGACIGFLFYNLNPASIFMGDTGALFLGFTLACLAIKLRFPDNSPFVTWMVPVFVLGVPIFDTSLVIVSRLRRGLNPLTTPGKDHLSHRLARLTGSPREAVLICYLIAFLTGMVATFITEANVLEGYAVGIAAIIVGIAGIWKMEQIYTRAQLA